VCSDGFPLVKWGGGGNTLNTWAGNKAVLRVEVYFQKCL
jgi:hypothetical protein